MVTAGDMQLLTAEIKKIRLQNGGAFTKEAFRAFLMTATDPKILRYKQEIEAMLASPAGDTFVEYLNKTE